VFLYFDKSTETNHFNCCKPSSCFKDFITKRNAADKALLHGGTSSPGTISNKKNSKNLPNNDMFLPKWAPILIVVPPSVIDNWKNELNAWGHFAVSEFQGDHRMKSLERVKNGMDEILICGKSLFAHRNGGFDSINEIPWKLVIVDEFHEYKNQKSQAFERLEELRISSRCGCPIVGLSGTIMPNNHKELWTLVSLVRPGLLGDWKSFYNQISKPIMLSRCVKMKKNLKSKVLVMLFSFVPLKRTYFSIFLIYVKRPPLADQKNQSWTLLNSDIKSKKS